jgi:molybdopterin-guanine dinucleotide biosynthesis protein A
MLLDAIVLAGGDPEKDADLLAYAGGAPCKALIKLGEQTFLERIVAAMLNSTHVDRIVVVGLSAEHRPDLGPRVVFLPDAGSILTNGEAAVRHLRSTGRISERILGSTSDIPLITSQVVDDLIEQCLPYDVDLCYAIVDQEVMEGAFPGSGRTFIPLDGRRYAGGDINVSKPSLLDADKNRLREIIGGRKTFWKQVRVIGLDTLLLFLIRRLTISRIERRVRSALGLTGKAVIFEHAQVAMDVDKPLHLDVVRAAWARQESSAQAE